MRNLVSFVFVALLADGRRRGSERLLLLNFVKEVSSQEVPHSGERRSRGGVAFVYNGPPVQSGKDVGYFFAPLFMMRKVSVSGDTYARLMTPDDNRRFAEVRSELLGEGYTALVTDLAGNPIS